MRIDARTVQSLCDLSTSRRRPLARLRDWPDELDREQWFFSPELISLRGAAEYEELDERDRKRLSFFEAVNFFSLNLHGERALVQGLARRLHQPGNESVTPYLHHFLDEENGHMTWFGGFCLRYAGKVYPEKRVLLQREHAPGEEDFLFFARALVFEEVVDVYNRRMAADERLVPFAREINRMHHLEEKRHLAFGRAIVEELHARHADSWSSEIRARVSDELAGFLRATWAGFYNAEAYRDAGLSEPFALRRRAFETPVACRHRAAVSRSCMRFLDDLGVLAVKEPR